ncbi:MAG TPA: hypothetical protein PLU31_03750, partial [Treponemataceae bacterium]|nr:hypothetical protein [Treponemataceae bacterium]
MAEEVEKKPAFILNKNPEKTQEKTPEPKGTDSSSEATKKAPSRRKAVVKVVTQEKPEKKAKVDTPEVKAQVEKKDTESKKESGSKKEVEHKVPSPIEGPVIVRRASGSVTELSPQRPNSKQGNLADKPRVRREAGQRDG